VIAEHLTRRWQNAGLIDGALARRIIAWEASRRRPIWPWALGGTGALAIALGIMAIVGANWDDIPAWIKLSVDLALNSACAVAVYVFWRAGRDWLRELSALLLFGLVLSGIALIGQLYQLQSEPWNALVLWLVLCTPFLALTAVTRLTGAIWAIAVVTTWFSAESAISLMLGQLGLLGWKDGILSYLPACGLIVAASLRGLWPPARKQADFLLKLSLATLILACSVLSAVSWLKGGNSLNPLGSIIVAALATIAAALACRFGPVQPARLPILLVLGASFAAWTAGAYVAYATGTRGDLERALLFIVYWMVLGAIAAQVGWRSLFGTAIAAVGLRLLVLYFEAIGGLTATGLGLLGGGVLCLALAAIGWRLVRRITSQPTTDTGTVP